MDNYILKYFEAMQSGQEIVGKWILLFYSYIITGLDGKRFFYSEKKARRAIRFVENFVHHSEGRSDLLKLELWQKATLSVIFGIVDEAGLRIFREVVIVIGRKNGKTLFASAIIAYMLFLDGEHGAKIYCLAPKLDQADLVYNDFKNTVELEPELAVLVKPRKADLYVAETQSAVKKLAFNAKKADGFNPHLTVCDEIASWPAAQGLKQYEVMASAMGARAQPMLLSITTSGYINDGIYDELIKRSTRFLLGTGESRESRLAPFLYMIDDLEKWDDMAELHKSMPNLGVSVSEEYLREEIVKAKGSLSKKAEFLTKYCNIKQSSSQAWLEAQAVEKCCGLELKMEDYADSYCVGGIDLSRTTDLTACCLIVQREKEFYIFAKFFMPAEKLEEATARDGLPYEAYVQRGILQLSGDNVVDYHDCQRWFEQAMEEHRLYPLQIGYDRYSAQYLVQDMKARGFHMDDVYQGFNLTPVIHELEGLIKDGRVHIGDNDLLKIHLLNTALKVEAESERCKIVKMGKNEHIDGCAALLDAVTVQQKHHDEIGEQLKNEE